MRALSLLLVACGVALAQTPDPAYEPLSRAYEALKARDYDGAVANFLEGIEVAPGRPSIRKDLGYTYLKIGENELAREQFREAMHLEPNDDQVAMEYAFLCYETKEQGLARRIFDRIRQSGNAVAEQAFHNIDDPLATGITRWKRRLPMGRTISAHISSWRPSQNRETSWNWRPSITKRRGAFPRNGVRC